MRDVLELRSRAQFSGHQIQHTPIPNEAPTSSRSVTSRQRRNRPVHPRRKGSHQNTPLIQTPEHATLLFRQYHLPDSRRRLRPHTSVSPPICSHDVHINPIQRSPKTPRNGSYSSIALGRRPWSTRCCLHHRRLRSHHIDRQSV